MARKKPSIFSTQVTEWKKGAARRVDDYVAGEEPLEIRLGDEPFGITLRTPGHDLELAAGLLFAEGIVRNRAELLFVRVCEDPAIAESSKGNIVIARLSFEAKIANKRVVRQFTAGSACGACGKAAIEDLRIRGVRKPENKSRFDPNVLCSLPDELRAAQTNFNRTGGLHAAALFDNRGKLLALREDIGRHNAVDKVIGWAFNNDRLPLDSHILLVSGRGGFEIVQKALMAGVPLLASVSAPSSLAVKLGREFGMTLVGFLRGVRFVIYAGEDRLEISPAASQ